MTDQGTTSGQETFDLVVIGSGPGGYVAAIRAAQLGMRVACVERDSTLGGTCLNVGCIPSKAMLESSERFVEARDHLAAHGVKTSGVELDLPTMLARKNKIVSQLTGGIAGLFKKNKISRIEGHGSIPAVGEVLVTTRDGEKCRLKAGKILIATGSTPASLAGVEFDGDRIGTSTQALAYTRVPKHLIVIGAGVIGLELGSVWARLGAKVTILEFMPKLLPAMDEELTRLALRLFKRQGLHFTFGARVKSATVNKEAGTEATVSVTYQSASGEEATIEGDRVLVAVGRRPNTEGLGLEAIGVDMDRRGNIIVDEQFQSSVPGIWAIGDVIPGPMLAHKASEEGSAAVECMAGQGAHICYDAIPNIIYTNPEIAAVGSTEAELKNAGIPYRKGTFPFMANGRAKALGQTDGLVKILAHAETDRILGFHCIGPRAGDLIAEAAIAVEFSASAEDLARSVHAHPTLAEAIKEAALAVDGRVIHL
ncbi:MAG TPA: dihydrolipoyl dehydrogenase [Nannocystis exedens]|nr:dihydrolipoyl dehydrogenase [Nannocystis exedens]